MTLDDIEVLARQQLSGEASADSHVRQLLRADKLARFIVNVLPVVKAAEVLAPLMVANVSGVGLRGAWFRGYDHARPVDDLKRAVATMRAALGKEGK